MYRAPAMSLLYAGARLLCHGVSPCVAVCLTESMLALKWYSELIGPDYGVLSAKAHGPHQTTSQPRFWCAALTFSRLLTVSLHKLIE
jgi:hypothetical protein